MIKIDCFRLKFYKRDFDSFCIDIYFHFTFSFFLEKIKESAIKWKTKTKRKTKNCNVDVMIKFYSLMTPQFIVLNSFDVWTPRFNMEQIWNRWFSPKLQFLPKLNNITISDHVLLSYDSFVTAKQNLLLLLISIPWTKIYLDNILLLLESINLISLSSPNAYFFKYRIIQQF